MSIMTLLLSAFLDSFKICNIGVLVSILTYSIMLNDKKSILPIGLTFSISVALAYFFYGVAAGLLIGYIYHLKYIVIISALIYAFYKLYKAQKSYGTQILLKPFIQVEPTGSSCNTSKNISKTLKNKNLIQIALLGFTTGIVFSPCSSGIYLIVLSQLSSDLLAVKISAYLMLLLYNLISVLPMVIITAMFYFSTFMVRLKIFSPECVPCLEVVASYFLIIYGLITFFKFI